jgi:hypothetical protein
MPFISPSFPAYPGFTVNCVNLLKLNCGSCWAIAAKLAIIYKNKKQNIFFMKALLQPEYAQYYAVK